MRYSFLILASAILGVLIGTEARTPFNNGLSAFHRSLNTAIHFKLGNDLIQPKLGNELIQPRAPLSCGEYVLEPGTSAVIQSKNFPRRYPRNYYCNWSFTTTSPTSTISVNCFKFSMKKCRHSFLTFTDDSGLNERYCGKKSPYTVSNGNSHLNINFATGNKRPAKGFRCRVTASQATATTTTTTNTAPTTTPSSPTNGSDCACGVVNSQTRIVGGEETLMNEYPWQAALVGYGGSRPFCGASIISDTWILTAAHCLPGLSSSNAQVIVGEHDWSLTTETSVTQRLDIQQLVPHSDYNDQTSDNDIALIQVASPITFSGDNLVAPVCLPNANDLFENVNAIVSGWGTLESGGNQPNELNDVTVPTMSNSECQNSYGSSITENMICAGLQEGGKDSCQGDSGGPLVTGTESDSYMIQIGVVSFGYGCAFPGYPGVYARVNRYLPWIASNIDGSATCSPPAAG